MVYRCEFILSPGSRGIGVHQGGAARQHRTVTEGGD